MWYNTFSTCIPRLEDEVTILNIQPLASIPIMLYSVGIDIQSSGGYAQKMKWLRNAISQNLCMAIGTCKLDKNTKVRWSVQKNIFLDIVKLSETYKKPLLINLNKCHEELLLLKKQLKPKQCWIYQGFSKNSNVLNTLINNGMYVSFGSSLFDSEKAQNSFLEANSNKILLELDNDNISIIELYKKAAQLKSMSIEEMRSCIEKNFTNIFKC